MELEKPDVDWPAVAGRIAQEELALAELQTVRLRLLTRAIELGVYAPGLLTKAIATGQLAQHLAMERFRIALDRAAGRGGEAETRLRESHELAALDWERLVRLLDRQANAIVRQPTSEGGRGPGEASKLLLELLDAVWRLLEGCETKRRAIEEARASESGRGGAPPAKPLSLGELAAALKSCRQALRLASRLTPEADGRLKLLACYSNGAEPDASAPRGTPKKKSGSARRNRGRRN